MSAPMRAKFASLAGLHQLVDSAMDNLPPSSLKPNAIPASGRMPISSQDLTTILSQRLHRKARPPQKSSISRMKNIPDWMDWPVSNTPAFRMRPSPWTLPIDTILILINDRF